MAGGDNSNKRSLEFGIITKRKIHLKIQGQDGSVVHFEVKRHVPMQKVLLKYCERKNIEYRAMNFIYHGSRVLVRRTLDELHMEDGDVIEAMVHVHGGGHHRTT